MPLRHLLVDLAGVVFTDAETLARDLAAAGLLD
jgi:hypothetical protein